MVGGSAAGGFFKRLFKKGVKEGVEEGAEKAAKEGAEKAAKKFSIKTATKFSAGAFAAGGGVIAIDAVRDAIIGENPISNFIEMGLLYLLSLLNYVSLIYQQYRCLQQ